MSRSLPALLPTMTPPCDALAGYFKCRACSSPLFAAAAKFKSGCGWPAFDRCYVGSIILEVDVSHGMARREVVCARCRSHLGHLFVGEGATPTNQRHCVNSLSIKFVKESPSPVSASPLGQRTLARTRTRHCLTCTSCMSPPLSLRPTCTGLA
jgi:methionine-R-sulfoxide reductase